MHTDNNHNTHTSSELYKIIETVRQREGKSTLKLVAERIGRSISGTWHLLTDAGMPTRLYSESLSLLEERIRTEGANLTLQELYSRFGGNWANPVSFAKFLYNHQISIKRAARHCAPRHQAKPAPRVRKSREQGLQLLKDVRENGYDLSPLTRQEIAQMYGLSYPTTCAYVAKHQLPCTAAARGRPKRPAAPSALL